MKVKILLGVMFLFILPFISAANDTRIIDELEQVLQQRSFYLQKKENRIDSLKFAIPVHE